MNLMSTRLIAPLPKPLLAVMLLCSVSLHQRADTLASTRARLEEEVAKLDERRDQAVSTLRQQYIEGLERRMQTLSGENLRVLTRERDRAADEETPLRPPMLSENPGVRHYQDILVKQLDRIERPRAERLAVLVDNLQTYAENRATQLRASGQSNAADEWEQWAAGLPRTYLDPRFSTGGKTRFFTLLESGQKPYLLILGTSTSEFPKARIDAPWVQCASGTRANWPGTLSQHLKNIGELRLGGNTCAGASSELFLDGSGSFGRHTYRQLDWLVDQNPDAVIIEFAVGTDCVDSKDITVADSRANHEKIIRELRKKNPQVEVFIWNGVKSFNQGRLDYGSHRDGSNRKSSNEVQEDYAQMCIDLANEAGPGIYYIDTFSLFSEILEEKGLSTYRTYFRDGNHTNQRGGEEIIVPEILNVLEVGNP